MLLLTNSKAQNIVRDLLKAKRLQQGFTQKGLANRSGVSLPTLRKFEQQGAISLESFIKILMVLGCMEDIIHALQIKEGEFESIDDVLENPKSKPRKHGWRL